MHAPAPSSSTSTSTSTSPRPAPDTKKPAGAKAAAAALPGGYAAQAAALVPGASPVTAVDPAAVVRELAAAGTTDVNLITNEVFWREHELLRGVKLQAGTPEAARWLALRDEVVKPTLAAITKPAPPPDDDKDLDDPGPPPAVHGAATASGDDAYYNQNNNSYDDAVSNWAGGSAGKNTCNMTALTMALVSIAGDEATARAAVVQYLRKKGARDGATATIGNKRVSLGKVLKDDALLAEVQLEDLVIAAAVALGGSYKSVTAANTILGIAKKTGLVKDGSTKGTKDYLSDPEVRASAREALDRGQRIVAQTKGHYVYLVGVRDDGILVHDPAGARIAVSGEKNLWPGTCDAKLGTWLGRLSSEERRETALRRTAEEPGNAAFMARAVLASRLSGQARSSAKDAIKADFTGYLALGKNNFYGLGELDTYKCRVGITLEPADAKEGAEAQADAGA